MPCVVPPTRNFKPVFQSVRKNIFLTPLEIHACKLLVLHFLYFSPPETLSRAFVDSFFTLSSCAVLPPPPLPPSSWRGKNAWENVLRCRQLRALTALVAQYGDILDPLCLKLGEASGGDFPLCSGTVQIYQYIAGMVCARKCQYFGWDQNPIYPDVLISKLFWGFHCVEKKRHLQVLATVFEQHASKQYPNVPKNSRQRRSARTQPPSSRHRPSRFRGTLGYLSRAPFARKRMVRYLSGP